jgi:two-component system KDP operon response regulator KdpE
LSTYNYMVYEAASGQEALTAVISHRPDLLILDLGLPDIDGIDVIRQLREWTRLPIIVLSVRERETDKISALDAGADDYLTKPFGIGELMARLRVMVRRTAQLDPEPVFSMEGLEVDLAHRRVTSQGREVQLTPTEYDLLRVMVLNAGKVLTHRQLLRQVWGLGYEEEMHLLRVNISNLRRKIEVEPNRPYFIVTEPGVGYRLRANL